MRVCAAGSDRPAVKAARRRRTREEGRKEGSMEGRSRLSPRRRVVPANSWHRHDGQVVHRPPAQPSLFFKLAFLLTELLKTTRCRFVSTVVRLHILHTCGLFIGIFQPLLCKSTHAWHFNFMHWVVESGLDFVCLFVLARFLAVAADWELYSVQTHVVHLAAVGFLCRQRSSARCRFLSFFRTK